MQALERALAHRGPDGQAHWMSDDRKVGLVHTRLSILDLSADADQPMHSADGRYTMVFNGEVFNFLELRDELSALGHTFKTNGDTEVILHAYAEWGEEAFHRFNGMWAIAIWDNQQDELLLCRDRFGIKPLYYYQHNDVLAFASETNAFKYIDGHSRTINEKHLRLALEHPNHLEGLGHTVFNDIFQLLPGHLMRINGGQAPQQQRWYDVRSQIQSIAGTYEERIERFRELFEDSCRLRMRSDVSMATALSGGLDSSSVYGTIHQLIKNGQAGERIPEDCQRAFIATFPGTPLDEREYAQRALDHTKGNGTFIDVTSDNLVEELVQTTQHFDAISATPLLALTGVYKAVNAHGYKISLDGHGVDEMLFGYRDMVSRTFEHSKWQGEPEEARAAAKVLEMMFHEADRPAKAQQFQENIDQAFKTRSGLKHRFKEMVGAGTVVIPPLDIGLPSLSDKPYKPGDMGHPGGVAFEEFFLTTLPTLLRNFDKAAMLSSVEIRMPFMDYRLVEFVFGLPHADKLSGGYTKRILRDVMKGTIPEDIRTRTYKVGLQSPLEHWFQNELKEFAQDTISSTVFRESSLFDGKTIAAQADRCYKDGAWSRAEARSLWLSLNAHLISR